MRTQIDARTVWDRLQAEKRGARSDLMKQIAAEHNVSVHTLYRSLNAVRPKRKRQGKKKIDQSVIDAIARLKAEKAKNRELTTEDAIDIALQKGLITAAPSVATVNSRLREAGFYDEKVVQRMEAEYVNQVHYADFSRSEYVGIVGYDEAAKDWLMVFDGKSLRYKNKEGNQRVWLGSVVDKFSRCRIIRYYISDGETADIGLDLLEYSWNREYDEHPLNSLPENLKLDNGSLQKLKETELALKSVNVRLDPTTPGNKDAMGPVERQWRTYWQRLELYLLKLKGNNYQLHLRELNQLAHRYMIEKENRMPHPLHRGFTREQVYNRSLIAHPPIRYEGNLKNYATKAIERKVHQDRIVWVDNIAHKAPAEYIGEKILIYKNRSGQMVGQAKDGKYFIIKEFEYNKFGEFRSAPDTYREQMAKQSGETLQIKPKTKTIKPNSVHNLERAEIVSYNYDQARDKLSQQLNIPYSHIASIFDEFIRDGVTHKRLIEMVNVFRQESQTA